MNPNLENNTTGAALQQGHAKPTAMNTFVSALKKPKDPPFVHMERVDLLLMKLDFALDMLRSSAPSLSREELADACRRQGYSRAAELITSRAAQEAK